MSEVIREIFAEEIAAAEGNGETRGKWGMVDEMFKEAIPLAVIAKCSQFPQAEIIDYAKAHGYTPVM